ncbi:MAG: OmpA family protein [Cyclobacteriaceae bacterium]
MTRFIILNILLAFGFQATAQTEINLLAGHIKKAEKSFYKFSYADAIRHYKNALEETPEDNDIKLKIAESYRKLNDPVHAEEWYAIILEDGGQLPAEAKLHYAEALTSNQKYDEAKEWYGRYMDEVGDTNRGSNRLAGLNNMTGFFKDSSFFEIHAVNVNSEGSDFGPAFHKNGMVFVSERGESVFVQSTFNWDNTNYLDLFYSWRDEEGNHGQPIIFNSRVNTKYHEGPLVFYDDDQRVVFTRNNYYKLRARKSSDNVNNLQLFFAEQSGDSWGNLQPFKFNSREYSVGHPAISEDGNKMFFASNMPGGVGLTDIYVVYNQNGDWSEPKNLGPLLNTEGSEMFTSLTGSTLYVASDGHPGLGGLDVYRVELNDKDEPLSVENIGFPINSSKDDFGLIMNDAQEGYFATNRNSETSDDIYFFRYTKPTHLNIRGKVISQRTGEVLPKARVNLSGTDGIAQDALTGLQGTFSFQVPWGADITLAANKESYVLVNEKSLLADNAAIAEREIILEMRDEGLILNLTVVDDSTKSKIHEPALRLVNVANGKPINPIAKNDSVATYQLEGGASYTANARKYSYFTNSIHLSTKKDQFGDVSKEIPLEKIVIGKAIALDNIYYNYNKASIREDAKVELDKLVKILVDNPTIEIELDSHTDARGNDKYNQDLSQRRAESAVAYLISQGIAKERVVAHGFGEERLVNRCADGVKCSDEEHQENRRTEFAVTKF